MNYNLLDSPWRAASNGGIFISLGSMDEKLFTFYSLEIFINNSLSTADKSMKLPPFDAAHQDESNEL